MYKAFFLGRGGIFGCFEKQGLTRQTITATAKVHVAALVINSNLFHNIVKKNPVVAERLQKKAMLHYEYEEGTIKVSFRDEGLPSNPSIVGPSLRNVFVKFLSKLTILINRTETWYKYWEYIICVHVSSISSLTYMFYIVMLNRNAPISPGIKAIIYLLDLLFLLKIYFGFHLTYSDPKSGIMITNIQKIRIKYLKSLTFWIDIITCFPLEIFAYCFTNNYYAVRYSLSNRIFRFLYLKQYYNYFQGKLHIKPHLRWTFVVYWICISIQMMTCLWFVFSLE